MKNKTSRAVTAALVAIAICAIPAMWSIDRINTREFRETSERCLLKYKEMNRMPESSERWMECKAEFDRLSVESHRLFDKAYGLK